MVEARLLPVALDHRLKNLEDRCTKLRLLSDISLQRKVVAAMTTNETYFFSSANQPILKHSVDTLSPALLESRRTERKLTFWSAAASTGQLAYSLSIYLCEMGRLLGHPHCRDPHLVAGHLPGRCRSLQPSGDGARLAGSSSQQYCSQPTSDTWEVNPILRRMVTFQLFDLRFNIRSLGPFDVVFCRNVLVYFDPMTKSRIIEDIHNALRPGSCLFLGVSEVSLTMGNGFTHVLASEATFFKSV